MKKLLFLFCLLQTALTAQVSVSFAIHNNSHPLFREPDDLAIYSTVSSLPDTLLSGTRLFLNGEWHHEPGNEQIAWDLLMHLYKNQNVRVLSGEMSVSTAYLLNYYSETDQEEPYSQCLSRYGLGLEERWFFRHLYEFNKDKTKETRIAIRGVDSGGDAKDACEAIRLILEKNSIVNELNDYNTMLNEIGEMDPDSTMSVAKKFL
ncbi:MAG TPA: hypothetical protein VNZ86_05535, partial [Bacteroidia bacterium]|nr:hypothetical protein [Bacteroidia bacterium]